MSDKELPTGANTPSTSWGEFNQQAFVVQQMLGKLQTATLVKVLKCTNAGELSPVGFVDVLPLVFQIDAGGKPVPHTTIFNVPYFRLQGGANAIIIDPEPDDVGIAVFASRDISTVKSTKKAANPGSFRQYSFSDALYIGGLLNAVPTQYVEFSTAGIRVHSPTLIKLDAPDIHLVAQTVEIDASTSTTITTPTFTVNGNTVHNGFTTMAGGVAQTGGGAATFSGSMAVTGDVTAVGTSVHSHVHGGVQSGGSSTSPPL